MPCSSTHFDAINDTKTWTTGILFHIPRDADADAGLSWHKLVGVAELAITATSSHDDTSQGRCLQAQPEVRYDHDCRRQNVL